MVDQSTRRADQKPGDATDDIFKSLGAAIIQHVKKWVSNVLGPNLEEIRRKAQLQLEKERREKESWKFTRRRHGWKK